MIRRTPHRCWHGRSGTSEYHVWEAMKARCLNEKHPSYPRWGGRGIRLCERWMQFDAFIEDMGPCPEGMSIDRIDNDGHYEPSNCRWTTREVQNNNCSRNLRIEHDGRTQTMMQWCRELGFKFTTLSRRYHVQGHRPPELFRPLQR